MNRLRLYGQHKKPLTGRKRIFSSELRYIKELKKMKNYETEARSRWGNTDA